MDTDRERVKVSVVMPSYNEAPFIRRSIESLVDDYFKECGELVVVDGMSEDGTRDEVKDLIDQGLRGKILINKDRYQSHGLNLGIKEAMGEIILRADAHCIYPPGYIKKCVELLEKTDAANVGGVMLPEGKDDEQKSVALAMRHPMGVGNAQWHLGTTSGYVDTVYLGTFRKTLFDEIGLFDTKCQTNEDAELNLRILKSGKKIFLDNSIGVTYYPRETLKKLAKQYFKYGRGRAYTTLKHKTITSWRQLAPLVLILGLIGALGLSFWEPLFLLFPLFYVGVLSGTALLSWRGKGRNSQEVKDINKKRIMLRQRLMMAASWAIMHLSWGVGFVSYLIFSKKIK